MAIVTTTARLAPPKIDSRLCARQTHAKAPGRSAIKRVAAAHFNIGLMKIVTILALATSALAASSCNPLKATECAADPALATSIKENFAKKSNYFPIVKSESQASYGENGLTLSIKKRFDNPSFKSSFYIMFGKVEVVMQAAAGQGIVSSFYLQSDDLDEIDIEMLGGDDTQFQSNFFSKGNVETYDRGEFHTVSPNPLENFHTYTIDWSKDQLTWSLDGEVVRTLLPNNPQGYPQTPMYIMGGIWAGGDSSNEPGTIEWAGGPTTYGPTYSMHIKSLIVTDYSTGEQYLYSDQTGSWKSIVAENGEVNGRQKQADSDFKQLQLGNSVVEASESDVSESETSGASETSETSETSEPSSFSSSPSSSSPSSSSSSTSDSSSSDSSSTDSESSSATKKSSSGAISTNESSSSESSSSETSTVNSHSASITSSITSSITDSSTSHNSTAHSSGSTLRTSLAPQTSSAHDSSTANNAAMMGISPLVFLPLLLI